MRSLFALICVAVGLGSAQAQAPAASAGTLKKIADTRSVTLGYRTEAAPFSFAGPDGQPAGYVVDLCRRVVASLERQLKVERIAVRWVPVTADNRIAQVASGAVDLECGTTTVTMGRSERVDFSSLTFIDGGSFVTRADGPRRLADLAGKTVGVLPGTTTEARLRAVLKERLIDARVLVLRDERDGVAALADKRIDAFANDRIALVGRVLVAQPAGVAFALAEEDFSVEPYALMMRRDADFRLAVNRALAQIYGGPAIGEVYDRWFGRFGAPSALLLAMFYMHAFGE